MKNILKGIERVFKMRKMMDKIVAEKDLSTWSKRTKMAAWYDIERAVGLTRFKCNIYHQKIKYNVSKGIINMPMTYKTFSIYDRKTDTIFYCIVEKGSIFDLDLRPSGKDSCYIAAIKCDGTKSEYSGDALSKIFDECQSFNQLLDKIVQEDIARQFDEPNSSSNEFKE